MSATGRELYDRGVACEQAGDAVGAFEAYRLSAKADPGIAAPFVGLARILGGNHQRSEAVACLERAVAREPSNVAIRVLLGRTLSQDGKLHRARRELEEALRLDGEADTAALELGAVCEDMGDRETAAAVYSRLLQATPGHPVAVAGLLGVAKGVALADAVEAAAPIMARGIDADAAVVGYALGKALARLDRHDDAFAAWEAANAARRRVAGPFDRAVFDARVDALIEIFSAEFFAGRRGWGDASQRPVFIVGLPRSGTSLTEQVLASHPAVFGAGELDILADLATGAPDRLGCADLAWPQIAPALELRHTSAMAAEHLSRLGALAPPTAVRVIDKQPLNFWHLPLIALTFPNARIIHCTRDLRDNGLSIFAEDFSPEQRWGTDLGDIAHYALGCRRLIAHCRAVSGLAVLDVAYEDLVADLEKQSRRLLDFLGLDFDPAVLRFHENDRAVQTPSRWQVRTPLYSASSGRWRRYERHLAALSDAL